MVPPGSGVPGLTHGSPAAPTMWGGEAGPAQRLSRPRSGALWRSPPPGTKHRAPPAESVSRPSGVGPTREEPPRGHRACASCRVSARSPFPASPLPVFHFSLSGRCEGKDGVAQGRLRGCWQRLRRLQRQRQGRRHGGLGRQASADRRAGERRGRGRLWRRGGRDGAAAWSRRRGRSRVRAVPRPGRCPTRGQCPNRQAGAVPSSARTPHPADGLPVGPSRERVVALSR